MPPEAGFVEAVTDSEERGVEPEADEKFGITTNEPTSPRTKARRTTVAPRRGGLK